MWKATERLDSGKGEGTSTFVVKLMRAASTCHAIVWATNMAKIIYSPALQSSQLVVAPQSGGMSRIYKTTYMIWEAQRFVQGTSLREVSSGNAPECSVCVAGAAR